MQSASLSSLQDTTFLFLIGSSEIKPGYVSSCIHKTTAYHYIVLTSRNHFIYSFRRINCCVCLINISQGNSISCCKCTLCRLFLSHYHSEESCFPGAIRSNNTNYTVWRKAEFKIFKKQWDRKRR